MGVYQLFSICVKKNTMRNHVEQNMLLIRTLFHENDWCTNPFSINRQVGHSNEPVGLIINYIYPKIKLPNVQWTISILIFLEIVNRIIETV